MANEIIQGDNGTILILTIQDDSQVVDLTNATVEVAIKFKATGILKQATITDAANGLCEITLDEIDIPHEGVYSFQATVKFTDGKKFSSNIERFTVMKKLNYTPNVGGGNSNIGGSSTNGNIIINGLEVKVYDDSAIRSDINNLKQTKHTHSNLEDLERLGVNSNSKLTIDGIELVTGGGTGGSTVSDSLTNGNIVVNGTEVKVYDDKDVREEISIINNLDIIKRLGINEQGQLTIDGIVYGGQTPPSDTTAPNNITNLSTSNVSATSLTLSWTASTSTDVASYDVFRGATLITTVTGTTYNVTGLTENTQYMFTVKAKDATNNIASGTSVTVTTSSIADTTAPNPVANLTAGTVTSNSIPVSWTLSTSSDVANYEVAYSTDGTNYTVSSSVVNASSNTYTVAGLTASTNYTIRVVAIDGTGNRSTVVTVNATTSAPADITAPVLTITPAATFTDSQTVTMSADETADIWYTTDGSDPTSSGTRVKYITALSLTATSTVKAYAVDVAGNASPVQIITYTKLISVTGVTLNKTTATIEEGNTLQLTATVSPYNADNKSVTWSSSDTAVATVDSNGLVTSVASGAVTISVTTVDGGFTSNCSLTVTQVIIGFDYNNLQAYPTDAVVSFDQTVNDQSDWVHPSVLYFENGWNGHKYWMGVNPYPDTQSSWEDPFIFYSDNGDSWFTPAGVTQPIFQEPTSVNGVIQHNSDSHLFMDKDGITVHYLNRAAYASPTNGSLIEIYSSTDGVNWGNRATIIDDVNNGRNLVSPSVCLVNGKYYMFATDTDDQNNLVVLEATEVRGTWTEINRISTGTLGAVWHPEVRYINQEFIVVASTNGTNGGNLMLGKFFNVMDATIVGRNNAFITPPQIAGAPWTTAIYKSSLVVKNNEDIEVFIGFKGGALNASTDWRVSRVQAQRLTQTLDISSTYQEISTYNDNSTFTTPGKTMSVDFNKYAVEFTVSAIGDGTASGCAKYVAFSSGTTQHFNLSIQNGILRAEIWKEGVHSFKNLSYGLSINDRVLLALDNDLEVYINGRLVHTVANAAPLFDAYGKLFGDLNGVISMSNIKVYKKEAYVFSPTKATDYKTELLNEYAITTSNFALVDEFNRTTLGTVSDNGATYEIIGSPTISSNTLKPNGNVNAVLIPTSDNYSLIFNLPNPTNGWQVYLRYTDSNNFVKIRNYQYTPFYWEIVTKTAGTEVVTNFYTAVTSTSKPNIRIDVINNVIKLHADGVHLRDISMPTNSFLNKVGFTSHNLVSTLFDYAIIKKLT